MSALKLIVGLGNPGTRYEATRHNAGFWFVDRVADAHRAALRFERKFNSNVARVIEGSHEIWLMQPQTFMNRSGGAVFAFASYYKIAQSEILIAYDELDLPPGAAKLKHGGGHAGHNGLKDIVAHFGGLEFWRLRLGIGHPGDANLVADYVLHEPSREDGAAMDDALTRAMSVFPNLARGEFEAAMLRLHTKTLKESP